MNRACEYYEELISRSFDAPLEESEREALAKHLATCPHCLSFQADLSAIIPVLSSPSPALEAGSESDDLTRRIIDSLAQEPLPKVRFRSFRGRKFFALAAAVLLLATLLGVYLMDGALGFDPVTKITGLARRQGDQGIATPAVVSEETLGTLHLSDGSTLELAGNTLVRFHPCAGGVRQRIELVRGHLVAHVSPAHGRFLLETENGSVEALGTSFTVGLDPVKNTRRPGVTKALTGGLILKVAVLAGAVLLNSNWGQERLERGESREITSWAGQGRVLDPRGRPLRGARVWAGSSSPYQVALTNPPKRIPWRTFTPEDQYRQASQLGPYARGPVLTGDDGRFFVRNIPSPMDGFIYILHPDYLPLKVEIDRQRARVVGDGVMDCGALTMQDGLALMGRVERPDGKPLAGAYLAVAGGRGWGHSSWPRKFVLTDEQGRFVVKGLSGENGPLVLAAWDRVSPVVEKKVTISENPAELVFVLPAGTQKNRIVARVLAGDDGSPLAGCTVRLLIGKYEMNGESLFDMAITDGQGNARFTGVPPGEYQVEAVPADQQKKIGVHFPPPWSVRKPCLSGDKVTLQLQRPVALDGMVLDRVLDQPLSRFSVTCRPNSQYFTKEYRARNGNPAKLHQPAGPRVKGTFTLTDLRPGRWQILIVASGYQPLAEEIMVPSSGGGEPRRFSLIPASRKLGGLVVDQGTGKPLNGALVEISEWSPTFGWANRRFLRTSRVGTFAASRLTLDPKMTLTVEVTRDGYFKERLHFPQGKYSPAGVVRIALTRECTIAGRVVDTQGRPLDRVAVKAWREKGPMKGGVHGLTDHRGRFTIRGLRSGVYTLWLNGKKNRTIKLGQAGATTNLPDLVLR